MLLLFLKLTVKMYFGESSSITLRNCMIVLGQALF